LEDNYISKYWLSIYQKFINGISYFILFGGNHHFSYNILLVKQKNNKLSLKK
jgi:hypothetical protein